MARNPRSLRRPKTFKTGVWYGRSQVGTLAKAPDGRVTFTYAPTWLQNADAFPVASSLPLSSETLHGPMVISVFDNLLPDAEGELREKIAERIGAAGVDPYSLLSVLGRDCVGALQFLPENEQPAVQDMCYRAVSDTEMQADLTGLAAAPLAIGADKDFRISIAGAQEKTAYLRLTSGWAKPRGITPTSHIFKTPMGILPGPEQIDLSDSVENELFCMTLAHEIGLPVARVEKITLPEITALAVERFDRKWDGDVLKRLPQEDLCQSLGVASSRKYQKSGGPSVADILNLLRESDDPRQDRETFFKAQIFFYLIGASDGHAKNFSLRLGRQGRFRLAPLYDIISLAPVVAMGRLQRKRYRLAMSIDGHYGIDELVPRHFVAEGAASGFSADYVQALLRDMSAKLEAVIERSINGLGSQVPLSVTDPIKTDANTRARAVLALLD